MSKNHKPAFLLRLEILALGLFLWHEFIFESWAAPKKTPAFAFLLLPAIVAILEFALPGIIRIYASFLASKTQEKEANIRRSIIFTFSPFLLLSLTFLEYVFSLSYIGSALLLVSCSGFIYLQVIFLFRLKWAQPQAPPSSKAPPSGGLFLAALLIYALYLSGLIFPAQPFTGDEPHYLLITKSLISDGDINLANNYQNKDYHKFYPGDLDRHAYPGKKGEQELYSKHFPALPALLVPFYALGEKAVPLVSRLAGQAARESEILIFFSRFPVCVLTALLSLVFFLFAWEITKKRNIALLSWFIFSFASPVIFYSHLIYSEVPVALLLLWIAYKIIQKKNFSGLTLFGAGIGIGLLPWFGIKYILLALAMFVVVLFLFLKAERKNVKKAVFFLAPLAVSAGFFIYALLSMYGNLLPQTIYRGTVEAKNLSLFYFLNKDLLDFFSRILGYFFDQRAGIFAYAPVYVLLIPGFFLFRKKKKMEAFLLLALLASFWIFCSLMKFYWGGYCPPVRPLLPVVWVPGLFMAAALAVRQSKLSLFIRNVLLFLSFWIVFVSLRNPRLLYHDSLSALSLDSPREVYSNILASFSNILINWQKLVPSLSNFFREQKIWTPLVFWLAGVLAITVIFLRQREETEPEPSPPPFRVHLIFVFFISLFLVVNAFFNVRLENGFALENNQGEVFLQDRNSYGPELGGIWVRGKSKTGLVIRTEKPASEIRLSLASPVQGKTAIRLGHRKQEVERDASAGSEQAVVFSSSRGWAWRGRYLYLFKIEESSGFYPYLIATNSKDRRFLGVFIKIRVSFSPLYYSFSLPAFLMLAQGS